MGIEAILIPVGEREKAAAAIMVTAQALAARHSTQAKTGSRRVTTQLQQYRWRLLGVSSSRFIRYSMSQVI